MRDISATYRADQFSVAIHHGVAAPPYRSAAIAIVVALAARFAYVLPPEIHGSLLVEVAQGIWFIIVAAALWQKGTTARQ